MAYEICMPQLSDAMDEGKLIAWKVKEGEYVHQGDVIAEVESDKAIMEVPTFQEGTVEHLALKEGESAAVGSVIATLSDAPTKIQEKHPKKEQPKEEKALPKKEEQKVQKSDYHDNPHPKAMPGDASAKAKVEAAHYHLDLERLQAHGKLPTPAHEVDIKAYHLRRYFTPKALKLLEDYQLDATRFDKRKKHDSTDILTYIKTHNIPRKKTLDNFQKALIAAVETSAKKPIYHIYDRLDISEMKSHKSYTITVWLIKIFAEAMMQHEAFRARLEDETIMIVPNASISLAIAHDNRLYMPVFKSTNLLSTSEIDSILNAYREKARTSSFHPEELAGATFGISNLGMLGIECFDAMINQEECGIAAIGGVVDGTIMITLTLDHRLINGYQGAEFMQTLKSLASDETFFKEL